MPTVQLSCEHLQQSLLTLF